MKMDDDLPLTARAEDVVDHGGLKYFTTTATTTSTANNNNQNSNNNNNNNNNKTITEMKEPPVFALFCTNKKKEVEERQKMKYDLLLKANNEALRIVKRGLSQIISESVVTSTRRKEASRHILSTEVSTQGESINSNNNNNNNSTAINVGSKEVVRVIHPNREIGQESSLVVSNGGVCEIFEPSHYYDYQSGAGRPEETREGTITTGNHRLEMGISDDDSTVASEMNVDAPNDGAIGADAGNEWSTIADNAGTNQLEGRVFEESIGSRSTTTIEGLLKYSNVSPTEHEVLAAATAQPFRPGLDIKVDKLFFHGHGNNNSNSNNKRVVHRYHEVEEKRVEFLSKSPFSSRSFVNADDDRQHIEILPHIQEFLMTAQPPSPEQVKQSRVSSSTTKMTSVMTRFRNATGGGRDSGLDTTTIEVAIRHGDRNDFSLQSLDPREGLDDESRTDAISEDLSQVFRGAAAEVLSSEKNVDRALKFVSTGEDVARQEGPSSSSSSSVGEPSSAAATARQMQTRTISLAAELSSRTGSSSLGLSVVDLALPLSLPSPTPGLSEPSMLVAMQSRSLSPVSGRLIRLLSPEVLLSAKQALKEAAKSPDGALREKSPAGRTNAGPARVLMMMACSPMTVKRGKVPWSTTGDSDAGKRSPLKAFTGVPTNQQSTADDQSTNVVQSKSSFGDAKMVESEARTVVQGARGGLGGTEESQQSPLFDPSAPLGPNADDIDGDKDRDRTDDLVNTLLSDRSAERPPRSEQASPQPPPLTLPQSHPPSALPFSQVPSGPCQPPPSRYKSREQIEATAAALAATAWSAVPGLQKSIKSRTKNILKNSMECPVPAAGGGSWFGVGDGDMRLDESISFAESDVPSQGEEGEEEKMGRVTTLTGQFLSVSDSLEDSASGRLGVGLRADIKGMDGSDGDDGDLDYDGSDFDGSSGKKFAYAGDVGEGVTGSAERLGTRSNLTSSAVFRSLDGQRSTLSERSAVLLPSFFRGLSSRPEATSAGSGFGVAIAVGLPLNTASEGTAPGRGWTDTRKPVGLGTDATPFAPTISRPLPASLKTPNDPTRHTEAAGRPHHKPAMALKPDRRAFHPEPEPFSSKHRQESLLQASPPSAEAKLKSEIGPGNRDALEEGSVLERDGMDGMEGLGDGVLAAEGGIAPGRREDEVFEGMGAGAGRAVGGDDVLQELVVRGQEEKTASDVVGGVARSPQVEPPSPSPSSPSSAMAAIITSTPALNPAAPASVLTDDTIRPSLRVVDLSSQSWSASSGPSLSPGPNLGSLFTSSSLAVEHRPHQPIAKDMPATVLSAYDRQFNPLLRLAHPVQMAPRKALAATRLNPVRKRGSGKDWSVVGRGRGHEVVENGEARLGTRGGAKERKKGWPHTYDDSDSTFLEGMGEPAGYDVNGAMLMHGPVTRAERLNGPSSSSFHRSPSRGGIEEAVASSVQPLAPWKGASIAIATDPLHAPSSYLSDQPGLLAISLGLPSLTPSQPLSYFDHPTMNNIINNNNNSSNVDTPPSLTSKKWRDWKEGEILRVLGLVQFVPRSGMTLEESSSLSSSLSSDLKMPGVNHTFRMTRKQVREKADFEFFCEMFPSTMRRKKKLGVVGRPTRGLGQVVGRGAQLVVPPEKDGLYLDPMPRAKDLTKDLTKDPAPVGREDAEEDDGYEEDTFNSQSY